MYYVDARQRDASVIGMGLGVGWGGEVGLSDAYDGTSWGWGSGGRGGGGSDNEDETEFQHRRIFL